METVEVLLVQQYYLHHTWRLDDDDSNNRELTEHFQRLGVLYNLKKQQQQNMQHTHLYINQ